MILSHVIADLFYKPHLITPARATAICMLLEARLNTDRQTATETPSQRARRGDDDDDEHMMDAPEKVADTVIIPVHGTIVPHPEDIAMSECGCALEELNANIDAAEFDTNIKRVIYDFRSPGGSVTGIPETARKIRNSRKRTIGYTGSECCSGALWLAAQCEQFYATQSSSVGSVGVYTLCLDMSKALKREGVKMQAISAGKFKLLGAYWKELTEEERDILQARVDKIYAQFKEAMESRRVVNDEHFGNGLVFDGEEAAEMGFTDGVVDGLEDILDQ